MGMGADVRAQLERLPSRARWLLGRVADEALARGADPYLVGGVVRDLLLGRKTVDLDVVTVGDATAIAAALAAREEPGPDLRLHERFGTATLAWPDGPSLDLITARREAYPVPGALPVVTPGTLDDDLRRRDFTINAMAVSLAPATLGELLDPLGGRADLAAGLVRVLHAGSFRDDPTRMLRATRYAGRLGFTIEPETLAWLRDAVAAGALATVSVDRTLHEFKRLLAEPAAAAMVGRLSELGLLAQLHPGLRWDDTARRAYADLDRLWPLAGPGGLTAIDLWMGRLAILAAGLTTDGAREAADALHLPQEAARLLDEVVRLRVRLPALGEPLPNSALGVLLDPFSPPAIATVAAIEPEGTARSQLLRYLTAVRATVPALRGDALRALGVPPGPIYREALAALLARKRDDPAFAPEGERAFMVGWLRERGALPEAPTE